MNIPNLWLSMGKSGNLKPNPARNRFLASKDN